MVMSFLAGIFAEALIGVCMSGIRQSYQNSQSGKVSNNYHRIHSKIRYLLFWYFSGFSFLRTSLIRIRRSHRCHFYDCFCRPSSDLTSAYFWNLWSCWTSVVLWYMCILGIGTLCRSSREHSLLSCLYCTDSVFYCNVTPSHPSNIRLVEPFSTVRSHVNSFPGLDKLA